MVPQSVFDEVYDSVRVAADGGTGDAAYVHAGEGEMLSSGHRAVQ